MKLIVTVDSEEDNWGNVRASHYDVENIEALSDFQTLCDDFRVTPTYLVTYPVVTDETAAATLRTLLGDGNCEVGAQCHPWNTPPFEELESKRNTMLCNLSDDLQHKKMAVLHAAIEQHLKISPVSFRCGRWGYNQNVAMNLAKLGYKVDSSITPFTDWTAVGGPDFSAVGPRAFRTTSSTTHRWGNSRRFPSRSATSDGSASTCAGAMQCSGSFSAGASRARASPEYSRERISSEKSGSHQKRPMQRR